MGCIQSVRVLNGFKDISNQHDVLQTHDVQTSIERIEDEKEKKFRRDNQSRTENMVRELIIESK
jgi:hypothetical protein